MAPRWTHITINCSDIDASVESLIDTYRLRLTPETDGQPGWVEGLPEKHLFVARRDELPGAEAPYVLVTVSEIVVNGAAIPTARSSRTASI